MPSVALQHWQTTSATALDELESAHAAIGDTGRGRRYATEQINHAYAVLLSSQFQGFARNLHSETVQHLVSHIAPASLASMVRTEMVWGRKLDRGNPSPGNIGEDFNRFGFTFWADVGAMHYRNHIRQAHLQILVNWRNAIAHQDFDAPKLGGRTTLHLADVRQWRRSCDFLARCFDRVIANRLNTVVGIRPWV